MPDLDLIGELDLRRDLQHAQTRACEAMLVLEAAGTSVTAFMTSAWPGVQAAAITGRLYHPDPVGTDMVVLPCWAGAGPLYNDDPIIADLIAFQIKQPERWFYRIGKPGLVLGDDLLDSDDDHVVVRLFRTPLAWLQGGCNGVVMLDDAEARLERERLAEKWRAAA